jgi:hypothetical protein
MMLLLTVQTESNTIQIIDHKDMESYKQVLNQLGYHIEKCKILSCVQYSKCPHPVEAYMLINGTVAHGYIAFKCGQEKEINGE